jgi:hypothetical protein
LGGNPADEEPRNAVQSVLISTIFLSQFNDIALQEIDHVLFSDGTARDLPIPHAPIKKRPFIPAFQRTGLSGPFSVRQGTTNAACLI